MQCRPQALVKRSPDLLPPRDSRVLICFLPLSGPSTSTAPGGSSLSPPWPGAPGAKLRADVAPGLFPPGSRSPRLPPGLLIFLRG